MAGPHMGGGQQELPQVRRDIKRPRVQDKERTTIDKSDTPIDNEEESEESMKLTRPPTKQKEAIIRSYDLSDKTERLMYTDQTG